MRGHEYVRSLVCSMLESQVPLRLAKIRTELDTDWPANPHAYLLADQLPLKEEQYPAVMVSSTTASRDTALQAGLGEFIYEYAMTVAVAVVSSRHGGEEQASVGRDRILLAVREALMLNASLADDCFLAVRSMSEQTGAAMETMQSKPMCLGNVSIIARVIETLEDPILDGSGQPAVVATHAETVLAVDAVQPLP